MFEKPGKIGDVPHEQADVIMLTPKEDMHYVLLT
jgi:hypothetical protein